MRGRRVSLWICLIKLCKKEGGGERGEAYLTKGAGDDLLQLMRSADAASCVSGAACASYGGGEIAALLKEEGELGLGPRNVEQEPQGGGHVHDEQGGEDVVLLLYLSIACG